MSVLDERHFYDETAAIARLEAILWPNGPVCPKCGNDKKIYEIKGKSARPGLRTCGACRKQFTVKVGTLFEDSHVPVHKWWQAVHLLCSSKKGISSHQLHKTLKVTYKTAWFMAHRIREAMRTGSFAVQMGHDGGVVEVDETLIGRNSDRPKGPKSGTKFRGSYGKNVVLALVERGGSVRSFHVEGHAAADLVPVINANVAREAQVMTDEASWYRHLNDDNKFASHDTVNHKSGEYAREEQGRPLIHTNTVESYFSVFKRGMRGTYQHCAEKHLHRYLAEFDFRHNARTALGIKDEERTTRALAGILGKRLMYRDSSPE